MGVAFVEFSGTDGLLAREGSEALAAALDAVVRNAQEACARHGVTFLESDINRDGGKLMLVAGAPGGGREVEDRILGMARLVVDRAGVLPLRAGVNRGAVYGGDFGPTFRRTYSIKGDAINLAARVMGKAPSGGVLATEAVLERVRRQVRARVVPPFMVKGVDEPVQASLVDYVGAPGAEGSAAEPAVATVVTPVRERELARVRPLIERSLLGVGGVVQVVADPGLGKSAFAAAVAQEASAHAVHRAVCGQFGGTTGYNAVRRLLRDVLGLTGGASKPVQVEALRVLVSERCPDLLPYFPLLAVVLDAPVPDTPETRDLGERFRVAKLVEVVIAFLQVVLDKPTVLLFEDVDEMDDSSAAIVTALAEDVTERPWLLVVTRPRGTTGLRLPEEVTVEEVELQPFDHAESVALLESWTVDEPVSRHLVEAIAVKAGGNPLFMEALLDVARERGTVAGLPDSLGAVVAGEIDRLTPRDRTVLRFASVLGDQFAFSSLHELVGDEGWVLEPGDLLRLDQFVQPDDDTGVWWRFSNAVVRDAAYAGLPFRLRRRMHRHVGDMLEKLTANPDEVAEQLATHFVEAGDHARAWRYARRAGERARAAYSYAEALDDYRRAVTAGLQVDEVPPIEIADVLESIGDVADLTGLSREAIAAYRRARDFARSDPVARRESDGQGGGAAPADRSADHGAAHRRARARPGPRGVAARLRGALAPDGPAGVHQLPARPARRGTALERARGPGGPAQRRQPGGRPRLQRPRRRASRGAGKVGDQPFGELALASYEKAGDLLMMSRCLNNLASAGAPGGALAAGGGATGAGRRADAPGGRHRERGQHHVQPCGPRDPPGPLRAGRGTS